MIKRLMEEMRFMKNLDDLHHTDRMDLAQSFKIRYFQAGDRVYKRPNELDSFYIIVEGYMGIFYPDHAKVKEFESQPGRIVYYNEEQA